MGVFKPKIRFERVVRVPPPPLYTSMILTSSIICFTGFGPEVYWTGKQINSFNIIGWQRGMSAQSKLNSINRLKNLKIDITQHNIQVQFYQKSGKHSFSHKQIWTVKDFF